MTIVHPIETVLARFRSDEISFSEIIAEAVLLALDRLELAVESLLSGQSLMVCICSIWFRVWRNFRLRLRPTWTSARVN